jgi:hypothetical protein
MKRTTENQTLTETVPTERLLLAKMAPLATFSKAVQGTMLPT